MPYVKQITIRTTLNRSLKYIVNGDKTDYGCFVTGVNCATNDKLAYKQMLENKKKHNKEKGTLGFHFIQSFKENEINDPYKVHEIGLKWADKLFGDKYQFIISTHLDKGHYHNHIIINSVSLEGKKFNACKQSLKDARDYSDEIAKEYNLNIIPFNKDSVPKSYKEWNEEKRGTSWKAHIKKDIDSVIKSSQTFEGFMEKMEQLGYSMKQGHVKYMTFKAPGMERSVRGKTLGPEYTEDRIKERILLQATFKFTETKRYRYRTRTSRTKLKDAARQYKYKHGSIAVNFVLMLALMRTLRNRDSAQPANGRFKKKDFSIDLQILKLTSQLQYAGQYNLRSHSDLQDAISKSRATIGNINSTIKEAADLQQGMKIAVQAMETYSRYKEIYDEIMGSTIRRNLLKRKYQIEYETFVKASDQLKNLGLNEREFDLYKAKEKTHGEMIERLHEKSNEERKHLEKLLEIDRTLQRRGSISSFIEKNEKDRRREEDPNL
ncbi:hypothetical protein BSK52_26595 [Paenibacillus odorifer]|uniref:MobA/VirD2-like nuclease domain-containing protein n=1 Tax=Paenibacillus odorifer TaxID=189426 RepID=A0A1R0XKU2_9BACL|nr:relaxase/mobilization nuclease domain-containing protein [Paenibacillus odorifer]OMD35672.1 hypothetical protein BSK52_26595 [Paenibacillus odorifer]